MTFKEWQTIIKTQLPNLSDAAIKGACVVAQLFIKDVFKPFCLVFMETGGSGKTLILNIFSKMEGLVIAEDDFTRSSLISHAANRTEEQLRKSDLMPALKNKLYLIRDLTTLFAKRDDDLRNILGLLTRALDGEGLATRSGVYGVREYTGKHLFMMLAASTPITHRGWAIMNQLGSRIFAWYLELPDKSEEELSEQISALVTPKQKEKICAKATAELFQTFQERGKIKWDKTKEKKEDLIVIARIARLTAQVRGCVNEDGFRSIEKPDRINYLLYNLARGHALLCGRDYINRSDLPLVIDIALASTTIQKSKILKFMLQNKGVVLTSDVERLLSCCASIAIKYMDEMEAIGVGEKIALPGNVGRPEFRLKLADNYKWFLTEEFRELYSHSLKKVN